MGDTSEHSDDAADRPPLISYDLEDLVERMAAETFHEAVDFEPAIGREMW